MGWSHPPSASSPLAQHVATLVTPGFEPTRVGLDTVDSKTTDAFQRIQLGWNLGELISSRAHMETYGVAELPASEEVQLQLQENSSAGSSTEVIGGLEELMEEETFQLQLLQVQSSTVVSSIPEDNASFVATLGVGFVVVLKFLMLWAGISF